MRSIIGKRVLFAIAGLTVASTMGLVTGCSQSEKTTTEVPFKKTAPPAAYSDWQKKMASGSIPR